MKELELYVHIPFCIRKCAYCDFLSAPAGKEVQEAYVDQLLKEIRGSGRAFLGYRVRSIFFGGGTPSILETDRLCRILVLLKQEFACSEDMEVTVEANPGTVSEEKLAGYLEAGVNRLSFGLQSADDRELAVLGRIHTWDQFLAGYRAARKAGFRNINIDLMSALPGQTAESYRRTLEKVMALKPEHLSVYSLMIEEGTPFYEQYGTHPELLPSEDEDRRMYHDTKKILASGGYDRYEISNYAKPGYECRHNLGYWERIEYRGYGLGAASLFNQVRYTNQTELSEYLKGNTEGTREVLTGQAVREEYFFLGLRKTDGVLPGAYAAHYEERIRKLISQQLLEEKDGRIRLTDRGIDVSNHVLVQFLD